MQNPRRVSDITRPELIEMLIECRYLFRDLKNDYDVMLGPAAYAIDDILQRIDFVNDEICSRLKEG